MRVQLVFQGGGAKGIYHVGALRSIEEFNADLNNHINLDVVGVAGTSIGAIVASLYAAGFSSDELVDKNGNINGIGSGTAIPKHFIGPIRWRILDFIRNYFKSRMNKDKSKSLFYKTNRRIILSIGILLFTLYSLCLLFSFSIANIVNFEGKFIILSYISVFIMTAILGVILFLVYAKLPIYLVNIKSLRPIINELISRKVAINERELKGFLKKGVTFADLAGRNGCIENLKIVATNVSTGRIKVFSNSENTKNVPIADAVMASLSLPFIFPPYRIGDEYFFDGGIMSNRPAWLFDFDRIMDPDLRTIIFDVESNVEDNYLIGKKGILAILKLIYKTLYAGILGEKALEIKPSSRNIIVPLAPEDVGLLDFDLSNEKIVDSIRAAFDISTFILRGKFYSQPKEFEKAANDIVCALDVLRAKDGRQGESPASERIFFSRPIENETVLRAYFCNDKNSTADRLFLPLDDTLAGKAFVEKKAICERGGSALVNKTLKRDENRYRRALKNGDWDVAWCVHIPLEFEHLPGIRPSRVVTIESSAPLSDYNLTEDTDTPGWGMIISYCKTALTPAMKGDMFDELFSQSNPNS